MKANFGPEAPITKNGDEKGSSIPHKSLSKISTLRWNSTFISTVDDIQDDGELRPRAHSDPGSDISRTVSSTFFHRERAYIDTLSEQMAPHWKKGASSTKDVSSDSTDIQEAQQDEQAGADDSNNKRHSLISKTSTESRSTMTNPGGGGYPPAVGGGYPPAVAESNSSSTDRQRSGSPSISGRIQTISPKDLRLKIDVASRREALAVIEEIPELMLHKSASHLVEDVQGKVALMRDLIKNRETLEDQTSEAKMRVEKALEMSEVIPDLIKVSFQDNVDKALQTVRLQVDGVIQGIEVTNLAQDSICAQMRTIPSEVQQIADQAVQQVVQESKEQARQQFIFALATLPKGPAALRNAKQEIIKRVPDMQIETSRAAMMATVDTVEQAVAALKRQDIQQPVSNQVVADTTLRAKAGVELDNLAAQQPSYSLPCVTNPGSIGHPEMCTRPCLYFTQGNCASGESCDFCHLSHPWRPVHLDKRHREMLKQMPCHETTSLVLSILREKVHALNFGADIMMLIDSIGTCPDQNAASDSLNCQDEFAARSKSTKMLLEALKAMTLRSLLLTLHRLMSPGAQQKSQEIGALMQELRYKHYL